MSVGDLKTDGLKGNNFPWQLKMLNGQQCACDQLTEINANTDDVEFLLSAILTTLQANTEYEAKFVVDTCNGDTVYLEVRVWNPDTSTWGPVTYYLPGSDTPVIPPGAATPGCLIYTDPSAVLALILGEIQTSNLILTDIETNTGDTITELQNLLALYTAGQSACADSLSVTLCTEQGLSLSAIENNTGAIATSTAAIDLDTTAISVDTATIVTNINNPILPGINNVVGLKDMGHYIGATSKLLTLSIYNQDSVRDILVSTDSGVTYVSVLPGVTINFDAGGLLNYFNPAEIYIDQNTATTYPLIIYTYIL